MFASTGIHGLKGREFNSVRALGRAGPHIMCIGCQQAQRVLSLCARRCGFPRRVQFSSANVSRAPGRINALSNASCLDEFDEAVYPSGLGIAALDKLYGLSAMLLKNFLIFRADLDDGLQAVGNESRGKNE